MLVFGPIPSRRLGRSLGINNIPPKTCSYSCVYCQLGNTDSMSVERKSFYSPERIFQEVCEKVAKLNKAGEHIDFLTFVPDGEPTLDINLGSAIKLLKSLDIKIAVISNASLIWDVKVWNALLNADWVSVKVDTVYRDIWRKINRPHGKLNFDLILEGILGFANEYKGTLVTETMLTGGLNDTLESLNKTAYFIKELHPKKSYILVPTRPPAEKFVRIPNEYNLNTAYQIYNNYLSATEFLIENEGTDFSYTETAEQELLSITSVHPMREDAVEEFLKKTGSSWMLIEELIAGDKLKKVSYSGFNYFLKNLGGNNARF